MMVFKRNQIVVLSLVLMIVVAGYLQYSYKRSSMSASAKDTGKIGEAVYVDSNLTSGNVADNSDAMQTSSIQTTKESKSSSSSSKTAVTASKQANDYFAQSKLEREISRGKDSDSLKAITTDANATKESKANAYEKMVKLIDNSQKEMRLESLIKEKGYADVIALFGDDGSLDIIVKAPNLTSAQAAQIGDIASRQANVPLTGIHLKNIY